MSIVLPPSMTKVTTFSKLIALILFVLLPFVGFYLGIQYNKMKTVVPDVAPQIKTAPIKKAETQKDLLKRCGSKVLIDLVIHAEHFTQVDGPLISPDCRHIAWSAYEGGVGGITWTKVNDHEGLFIYSEKKNKTERVVVPTLSETVSILGWVDRETIKYKVNDEVFTFDLPTE